MSANVVIINPDHLNAVKQKITQDGPENFHVLTDFDKTLTTAFLDGEKAPSLVAILRDDNYLTPDYAQKANALYDKYHPIEKDPLMTRTEKAKAMHEWWSTHFQLLIQSRLNIKDIENAAKSGKVRLRQGVANFIDILHALKIPLVILSSTGLGQEGITFYLKQAGCFFDNIHVISNSFKWDDQGYATGIKEPIIHSLNKNQAATAFLGTKKNRPNVLVLGDSPDDAGIANDLKHTAIIKVGFLNEEVEKNLDWYKKAFDALILKDGTFDFVNNLLTELFGRATSGHADNDGASIEYKFPKSPE